MVKSRRKLKSMKVVGARVYDPMPRAPKCVARSRTCANTRGDFVRATTYVQVTSPARKSRVLKSGIRRITYG